MKLVMKTCTKCNKTKNLKEFRKQSSQRQGLKPTCKTCHTDSVKEWNKNNPDRQKGNRVKKYWPGYSPWEGNWQEALNKYNEILLKQNNLCAVCKEHETTKDILGNIVDLAVDHSHVNLYVRGLLCSKCNKAVGLLGDNPDIVDRVSTYLRSQNGASIE